MKAFKCDLCEKLIEGESSPMLEQGSFQHSCGKEIKAILMLTVHDVSRFSVGEAKIPNLDVCRDCLKEICKNTFLGTTSPDMPGE